MAYTLSKTNSRESFSSDPPRELLQEHTDELYKLCGSVSFIYLFLSRSLDFPFQLQDERFLVTQFKDED